MHPILQFRAMPPHDPLVHASQEYFHTSGYNWFTEVRLAAPSISLIKPPIQLDILFILIQPPIPVLQFNVAYTLL